MNGFIEWLEKLNENDSKVRAMLRRSLAFPPGEYVPAYPYVEPFLKGEDKQLRRETLYLVAGVWAAHWREHNGAVLIPIGKACANHQNSSGSTSTERRFINLLDADRDQLPHRLRQMIVLLKEQPIDFGHLLKGLQYWGNDQKRTQQEWARDFYRNLNDGNNTETKTDRESNQ